MRCPKRCGRSAGQEFTALAGGFSTPDCAKNGGRANEERTEESSISTLAIDYWLGGGLRPRAFHITQIVLLVIVGAMLAMLAGRVLSKGGASPWHRWTALVAATLFCVHAGNTQTVNYISARSELLTGM